MPKRDGTESHSRRNFLQTIGVAGATVAVAGCIGSQDGETTTSSQSDTETTAKTTETSKGAAETESSQLRAGLSANEIATLDPALIDNEEGIQIASNIYNGLITYDKKLEVQPDLATDWEWTSDTDVTFYLREGVTFHDGEEFTGEDVKFSFERVLAEETGSPWAEKLSAISEITVEDEYTVTFTLDKTFSPLESYLVRRNMGGCIVSKTAVESGTNLGTDPVGTGPYQVAESEAGSKLELERFADYWKDGKPHMDRVSVKLLPDTTTLVTALEANDVDIVNSVPQQSLARLKGNNSVSLYSNQGVNVRYIGFNTREGNVFADKRVRQAASLAINRDDMMKVLGPDTFRPNRSPVPQSLKWAYTDDVPMQAQNKQRARELLKEAGAEGASVSIKVWKGQSWKKIANVARGMLNEVGFNAEVKVFEWGTFWDQVTKNNEFDAFVLGWTGLTDPDGYLYSQFHSDGSWNWMGYSNADVDKLLEQSRTATAQDERRAVYEKIQKQVGEDAVYACIANQRIFQAARSSVSGYQLLPTSSYRFENVQVDR